LDTLDTSGKFYSHDKFEGVAVRDNGNTVVISNDSDFGVVGLANNSPPYLLAAKLSPTTGVQDDGEFLSIDRTRLPPVAATATVTINVVTPLQAWRQTYFGTTAATGLAADTADYDGDGLSNLLEYALGTDPTLADGDQGSDALPIGVTAAANPLLSDRLALSFNLSAANPTDITYTVQATSDLVHWSNVASKTGAGAWTWLGGGTSHIVVTLSGTQSNVQVGDLVPLAGNPRRMMRLQITASQ
jgi:hypothetical protein